MIYIALAFGVTVYLGLTWILRKKYNDIYVIESRIEEIKKYGSAKMTVEEEELSMPVKDRLLKPLGKKILDFVQRVIPEEDNENLKRRLTQGGINLTVDEFNALRIIAILFFGGVLFLIKRLQGVDLMNNLLWALIGIIIGYGLVVFWLNQKISIRTDKINMQMPEVLDLLSVSVEAGLGFDQALKEVTDAFKGPLIDEFNTVKREMLLGKTKRRALMDMADRCNVEDLSLFVSAIIQGEQFGISLKNILRTQSFSIRLRHKQRIEQKAAKLPVKIILPVAIFIFPVLFIVVLGPTVFNLLESMKGF